MWPLTSTATRLIVDKATWAADLGLPAAGRLIDMAWSEATYAAEHAATTAVHVFGGYGITEEYDAQLYFRRAKGWTLIGGGRRAGWRASPTRYWRRRSGGHANDDAHLHDWVFV